MLTQAKFCRYLILGLLTTWPSTSFGSELELWYDRPAEAWTDALPIGNGHMGAMVFGRLATERLQFNEDTVWAAAPEDYINPKAGPALLAKVRQALFDGDQRGATLMANDLMSEPLRQRPYQPFGDLHLVFDHTEVSDYRRWLDLSKATAGVRYQQHGVTYEREYLASYPDRVIAIRLTADQQAKVSVTASLSTPHVVQSSEASSNDESTGTLTLRARVRDYLDHGKLFNSVVTIECRALVIAERGSLACTDDRLTVRNADSVTVYLVTATSYVDYQNVSADPSELCHQRLASAGRKTFDGIRRAHVRDYRRLFDRCTVTLGEQGRPGLPTDDRLLAHAREPDPSLAALVFQYGRYLMISSSRPGSQPANLQGVWNDSLAPAWESKYTTNINTEMNYWLAEITNLSECHEPLFDLIDDLSITGEKVARAHYDLPGWVFHHNTDGWRGAAQLTRPTTASGRSAGRGCASTFGCTINSRATSDFCASGPIPC